jgi:hypothetical protein
VVAWARGDTKEGSEGSCGAVIARNDRCVKRQVTDWQFTVYAPGEIRFEAPREVEALGVVSDEDLPF